MTAFSGPSRSLSDAFGGLPIEAEAVARRVDVHAAWKGGESLIMASDGCESNGTPFNGFSLSLTLTDEATARTTFAALAEDGEITMPIGETFWSPCFGMVTDKFGLGWMVTVP